MVHIHFLLDVFIKWDIIVFICKNLTKQNWKSPSFLFIHGIVSASILVSTIFTLHCKTAQSGEHMDSAYNSLCLSKQLISKWKYTEKYINTLRACIYWSIGQLDILFFIIYSC